MDWIKVLICTHSMPTFLVLSLNANHRRLLAIVGSICAASYNPEGCKFFGLAWLRSDELRFGDRAKEGIVTEELSRAESSKRDFVMGA